MKRLLKNTRLGCILFIAACASDTTGPGPREFSFSSETSLENVAEGATVKAENGSIRIHGYLHGSACGAIEGSLHRADDRTLALVVTQHDDDGPCIAVLAVHEFHASIGDLNDGRYHVQVLLTSSPVARPRTVYHDFVTVD